MDNDDYIKKIEVFDKLIIGEDGDNTDYKFVKHIIGRLLIDNNFNIDNSFQIMKERNWEHFYMFIDIHATILYPDYGGIAKIYYPLAKEILQKLCIEPRIKLIMYTCSHPHEIDEYIEFFKKDNIVFDYINKNPEVENTRGGYFVDKPYMNVLLDDKGGFNGLYDWYILNNILESI